MKPNPPYKILAVYWWNPVFWLAAILSPIVHGFIEMGKAYSEVYNNIKTYNLK